MRVIQHRDGLCLALKPVAELRARENLIATRD